MQPIRQLAQVLENLADDEHHLFTLADMQGAFEQPPFWDYLTQLVAAECEAVIKALERSEKPASFKM